MYLYELTDVDHVDRVLSSLDSNGLPDRTLSSASPSTQE